MTTGANGYEGGRRSSAMTLEGIDRMAQVASDTLNKVRAVRLRPDAVKSPPVFTGAQIAALCGLKHSAFRFHLVKGELPSGKVINKARRQFTLPEARVWVRQFRRETLRPEGAPAITIATGLFKGGIGKTTISAALAQGLTLRGHKVLLIDLDPQGSLTTLMGLLPNIDVEEEDTLLGLFAGDQQSVRYAIRPTYWEGIDLIPACAGLFGAEFHLPARQVGNSELRFWQVLDDGLQDVRGDYDIIIIDTPPALSYVTANAFLAADGIITPLPLSMLDFSSSVQFWGLFSDITKTFRKHGLEKTFSFVHVLLNKVVASDVAGEYIRRRANDAYGDHVLAQEIPATTVAGVASAEFGTAYDLTGDYRRGKAYRRAREAYDAVVDRIEVSVREAWVSKSESPPQPAEQLERAA